MGWSNSSRSGVVADLAHVQYPSPGYLGIFQLCNRQFDTLAPHVVPFCISPSGECCCIRIWVLFCAGPCVLMQKRGGRNASCFGLGSAEHCGEYNLDKSNGREEARAYGSAGVLSPATPRL